VLQAKVLVALIIKSFFY